MNIRPLYDKIIVKRHETETVTSGGIVLAESAQEKPAKGTVLAVGCGTLLPDGAVRPLSIGVGDTVLFGKYTGNDLDYGGETLVVMRESDVLAVVAPTETTDVEIVWTAAA